MVPTLEVYDCSTGVDVRVGIARFSLRRGVISTTFSYDDDYLSLVHAAYAIDPSFPLSLGSMHCAQLPGIFRDSSPDRWGRRLIEREHRLASPRNEPLRRLDDIDYLISVFDKTREGSLRFKEPEGDFLASSAPVPPLIQLPDLIHAAHHITISEAGHEQVKELLDAGSGSLGGARPKASVQDGSRLLLAKFSHVGDDWDVMAWEKTALDMAKEIGIAVPWSKLVRIGKESALLLERFDRQSSLLEGCRIPFISGMTVLGLEDGRQGDYADLAEALTILVVRASNELKKLFYRVAFLVAIGSTDDHLRNWGFLRTNDEWALSPLFDVNPDPYQQSRRVTSIVGEVGIGEVQGLKDLAAYAGLEDSEATSIVREIISVTARWKLFARKNGCSNDDINRFEPMFEDRARELRGVF